MRSTPLNEWIGAALWNRRVIVELPTDSIAQTNAGWDTLDRISKRLASDPRCDRVIAITTLPAN